MKYKKIGAFLIIIFIVLTGNVFAIDEEISIEGDEVLEAGKEYSVKVNISSEKNIGLVSGDIDCSDNIEIINVKGKEDWNLTYNEENGIFNIYNVMGEKQANIIEIQYKITDNNKEKKATLSIKDTKLTSIDYSTNSVGIINKDFKINTNNSSIVYIVAVIVIIFLTSICLKRRSKKSKKK